MSSEETVVLPQWKIELIEKRKRQENASHLNNNHDSSRNTHTIDIPAWKKDLLLRKQKNNSSRNSNIDVHDGNNGHDVSETNGEIDSNNETNKHLTQAANIEERLLPITKNPILLHDLEIRHSNPPGDGQREQRSASPGVAVDINNIYDSTSREKGDALSADQDGGNLKYGKGFVNRLRQKFSVMAGKDEKVSPPRITAPKPRVICRSPGERVTGSTNIVNHKTSAVSKYPEAVTRSCEDLLEDSNSSHPPSSAQMFGSVPNGLSDISLSTTPVDDITASSQSFDNLDSSVENEKPQANRVSNVRSMFEQFAAKPQVPPKKFVSSSRDTMASSSHSKVGEMPATDTLKPTNVAGLSEKSLPTVSSDRVDSNKQSQVGVKRDINENNPLVANSTNVSISSISKNESNEVEDKIKHNKDNNASFSSTVNNIPDSTPNSTHSKTQSNSNLYNKDLISSSINSKPPVSSSNTNSSGDSFQSSNILSHSNTVEPSVKPLENSAKAPDSSLVGNKSLPSGNLNESGKKAVPKPPGLLLIRPASNLPTSNTKTQYLGMTQYNDRREDKFDPPSNRIIPAFGDDDGAEEDDDPSKYHYEFIGGAVQLDRSLLSKLKPYSQLTVQFDDSSTAVFEYPSEQSLMDSTPAQPGDCDYEDSIVNNHTDHNDNINNSQSSSSSLMTTPGLAGGSLSSYKSRMQGDYEFGMQDSYNDDSEQKSSAEVQKSDESSRPASWSNTGTSDLLF